MSDDEADPELLQLLRERLGISRPDSDEISPDTGVLRDAEYIYNNAIDVLVDMHGTKAAAAEVYKAMSERGYSTETWSQHELHPKSSEGFSELDIANFVFTMDLLNFSFWSELSSEERYQVEYRGQLWTGYNSLVACLRRALEEGIPVTTSRFWTSSRCTDQLLGHVFRSATAEKIPLFEDRVAVLREAGAVLQEVFADDAVEHYAESSNAGEPEVVMESATAAQAASSSDTISGDNVDSHTPTQDGTVRNTSNNESESSFAEIHLEQATHLDEQEQTGSLHNDTSVTASLPSSEANAELIPKALDTLPTNETEPLASPVEQTGPQASPHIETELSLSFQADDLRPDHAIERLIEKADHSAGRLVNLLVKHFSCFRDETRFDGRRVRLLKRTQILVADLWAALNGAGIGEFHDIAHLTMFADYRVPQSLHSLGVLVYSPPLDYQIRELRPIEPGHSWEVQLRGCSIWAVELIRREILKNHPEATNMNAVLIDFFLYDIAKENEYQGVFVPGEIYGALMRCLIR